MSRQHDDTNYDDIRSQDKHDNRQAAPRFLLKLDRGFGLRSGDFRRHGGWFAFGRRDGTLALIAYCRQVGKSFAEMGDFEVAELAALQDGITPGGLRGAAANNADGPSGIVGKPLHGLADEGGQLAGVWKEPVEFLSIYGTNCHRCLRATAHCEPFCDLAAAM